MKSLKEIFKHKIDRSEDSHAILDERSRIRKAQKILDLIKNYTDIKSARVLDIGTGSGHIASVICGVAKSTTSVDIKDERKTKKGYRFVLVEDETLPFDDGLFDVVISNHVVEHVATQEKHFSEIMRVLKTGGIAYLATPNKYWLTDPHYKLPFISWLPRKISTLYLSKTLNREWDIYPLSHRGITKHLAAGNYRLINVLPDLINNATDTHLEKWRMIRHIKFLPNSLLKISQYLSPTLIYVIKKED